MIHSESPAPTSGSSLVPRPDAAAEGFACWSSVGVYGNGTCPELPEFVHCRNCPVYSSARVQLLNRDLPANYRRQWAEHFAKAKPTRETATVSAILFRLAGEWLALPTQLFQEVAERRSIHSLPHRRHGLVVGLANVRGEILICISLGHLLGLEKLPPREAVQTQYRRLLVVSWEASRFGFPVDEVHGPHRFHPDELKSPPATVAKAQPSFTQHILYWRDRAVGLLDVDVLFRALNASLA